MATTTPIRRPSSDVANDERTGRTEREGAVAVADGGTVFEAWLRSGAPWQPLGLMHDSWRWVDAMTLAVNAGLEMQRSFWQPWWDAQGDWLRRWTAAWPVE
jgi:hypothetical protein